MLLVGVRDDGRVARTGDPVTSGGQLLAQRPELVELAVEDAGDVALLVRHGLRAGIEVDHLQAPVAEHAAAERVHAALVGTAMTERVDHPLHERWVGRRVPRY